MVIQLGPMTRFGCAVRAHAWWCKAHICRPSQGIKLVFVGHASQNPAQSESHRLQVQLVAARNKELVGTWYGA